MILLKTSHPLQCANKELTSERGLYFIQDHVVVTSYCLQRPANVLRNINTNE